ncbi:MAG: hydrogenase maturation protease [Desulfoplanes sp.]|jgi:coenzyme F420 hydrogenase subunit delta|nr:hydrogenase maturation protease [Desulfoplanes sp.]
MDWSKMFNSRVVVFGCGNVLYADDGVGPVVIAELKKDPEIPKDVALLDVGTSIRGLLFDLVLSDTLPERVVVVDAVTQSDREPGEIFEIDVDQMDPKKIPDFTLHQFPTTNLLKELKINTGIDLKIVVVQAAYIPEAMEEGLSPTVQNVLPDLVAKIKSLF